MVFTGIDVGGSSIKGAPVDVSSGALTTPMLAVATPLPSTPAAVVGAIAGLVARLPGDGPVGVAVPSVVKRGIAHTAANIDASWIGANVESLARDALRRPVVVLNDADAAGIAEMRLGAGRDERGMGLLLTFGTGIGSALFFAGQLVPNTELGHLSLAGCEVEHFASGRARTEERLDWPQWAERVNAVLAEFERLFWPDLFILGGGLTECYEEFAPLLRARARIVPAHFRAQAGVVGAALTAADSVARGGST
jgi:polyphosphate glucokinase